MKPIAVFDMDGTLADSMGHWAGCMVAYLDDHNIPYPADVVRIITPLGYKGGAKYYKTLGAEAEEPAIVADLIDRATYAYEHHIPLKPGVYEYIQKMIAQGVRCFVLTASPHCTTDVCLKRNGVFDLFEKVWTVDDFGLTKDKVEIYHEAAARIGCKPEDICFFDDNLLALQTAKAAGLETVGIYDATSEGDQEAIQAIVDRYARSFEELL